MKIIQIGPYPISESVIQGGVEASVFGLSHALAQNHVVYVMDFPRMDTTNICEKKGELTIYRFHNFGKRVVNSVRCIPDIIQTILQIKGEICHIHGTNVFSWKIYQELKRIGMPVVVTVHGLIYVEKKNMLRRNLKFKVLLQSLIQSYYERRLIRNVPYLIVDTQYVAEFIKKNYKISNDKMTVVPQGIDAVYGGMSCSKTSSNILSVGAFSARKSHLFLIKAFEGLLNRGVKAHLTICGLISEPSYYQNLVQYVTESPFGEYISLKGNISSADLYKEYQRAHVFALHSQEESQGIALVEAMAVGLPVVATCVGGIPFVIKDKETGLLSEYGNILSFSKSLEILLTNKDVWEEMSRKCLQESIKYSWPLLAGHVDSIYQKVME